MPLGADSGFLLGFSRFTGPPLVECSLARTPALAEPWGQRRAWAPACTPPRRAEGHQDSCGHEARGQGTPVAQQGGHIYRRLGRSVRRSQGKGGGLLRRSFEHDRDARRGGGTWDELTPIAQRLGGDAPRRAARRAARRSVRAAAAAGAARALNVGSLRRGVGGTVVSLELSRLINEEPFGERALLHGEERGRLAVQCLE